MGCSPYFTATGTHPILPLDIAEATYFPHLHQLFPPLTSLQKRHGHLSALHSRVMAARLNAAVRFEREHAVTTVDVVIFVTIIQQLLQICGVHTIANCKGLFYYDCQQL